MPADLRDRLMNDPEVAEIAAAPEGHPYRAPLQARSIDVSAPSLYAKLRVTGNPNLNFTQWRNRPEAQLERTGMGRGRGFEKLTEAPVFEDTGKISARRPPRFPDLFRYGGWYVASQAFVDTVKAMDADALEARSIDWRLADGTAREGFFFVDIVRQLDAFDYQRSALQLYVEGDQKSLSLVDFPRAVKAHVPPEAHLFRDAYQRSDITISCALAKALLRAGVGGFEAQEFGSGKVVRVEG